MAQVIVLLAAVLAAPLIGAVVTVCRRGPDVLVPASAVTAAGWVVLAIGTSGSGIDPTRSTTHTTVDLGQLHVTSVAAAAFAGLALLVPVARPANGVIGSMALTSISLAAVTASSGSSSPDGRFAVGVIVVGLVAAFGLRSGLARGRARVAGPAAVVVATVLIALGLTLDDPAHASAAVSAGAFAAVASVLISSRSTAILLVPVAMLAVVRVPPPLALPSMSWTSAPSIVAGAIGVGAVLALVTARRAEPNLLAGVAFAVAATLAGLVGITDWRPVVLLLSVAAVAALATTRRLALVAALPALAALFDAAPVVTGQAQVAGAVGAVVVLVTLALVGAQDLHPGFEWPPAKVVGAQAWYDLGIAAMATAFALSSAWSWASPELEGFTEATATATAVAAIVFALGAARALPADRGPSAAISRLRASLPPSAAPDPAVETTAHDDRADRADGADPADEAEAREAAEDELVAPEPARRRVVGRFASSRTRLVDGSDG